MRGSGPEDVWVGATASPSGDILRWDGASWHVLPSPDAGYWQVPLVLGPRDAWVVENPYDATFTRTFARVAHFDGASWSESLTIDAPRVAAVTTTPGDVWAASDVGLWRFDGARWSSMHERMDYAVQLAADGDQVWVVSEDAESGSATVVMWDGSRVRTHGLPGAPTALHAVAGHAWIATRGSTSDGSNAVVHHWDGASWNALDTGATMSVQNVWASGPNDLWVVGAILPVSWTSQTGVIGHWDGEGWVRREAKDFGYTAVWGTGPGDVWLSGDTDYCQKCFPVPPEPTLAPRPRFRRSPA